MASHSRLGTAPVPQRHPLVASASAPDHGVTPEVAMGYEGVCWNDFRPTVATTNLAPSRRCYNPHCMAGLCLRDSQTTPPAVMGQLLRLPIEPLVVQRRSTSHVHDVYRNYFTPLARHAFAGAPGSVPNATAEDETARWVQKALHDVAVLLVATRHVLLGSVPRCLALMPYATALTPPTTPLPVAAAATTERWDGRRFPDTHLFVGAQVRDSPVTTPWFVRFCDADENQASRSHHGLAWAQLAPDAVRLLWSVASAPAADGGDPVRPGSVAVWTETAEDTQAALLGQLLPLLHAAAPDLLVISFSAAFLRTLPFPVSRLRAMLTGVVVSLRTVVCLPERVGDAAAWAQWVASGSAAADEDAANDLSTERPPDGKPNAAACRTRTQEQTAAAWHFLKQVVATMNS